MQTLQEAGSKVNDKGAVIHMKGKDYVPASYEHKWVSTKNERNLHVMMEMFKRGAGEGHLGEIVGRAGRGKSRTVKRYASNNRCIYLLCLETWKRSELPMLQALCRELGMARPPARSSDCFMAVVDRLIANPAPVFLDEMDLLPKRINLVRQLAEVTAGVFILIGEESLSDHMQSVERVWSRTLQTLHFEPVSMSDIIFYGGEAAGLEITPEAASLMHRAPGGEDWRVVRRLTIDLVEIANMHRSRVITEEMAKQAVNMGLKGNGRKGPSGGGSR